MYKIPAETCTARRFAVLLAGMSLIVGILAFNTSGCDKSRHGWQAPAAGKDGYLFCFWNVENLFDDQNDGLKTSGDEVYDKWMSRDPAMLNLKLSKLTEALLKMNDGKGPDILALAEVESKRAAELLQQALNEKISDPEYHYRNVVFKEVRTGRHIACAILTRFRVVKNRTRHPDKRRRILQTVLEHDGHELMILASHWTSRLRGGEEGRETYANKLYGITRAAYERNPNVDVLLCGDFNDTPQDVSVTAHLRATDDRQAVMSRPSPLLLFNLFGDKNANQFGTYLYRRKWYIYDQIVVTPGMLDDKGWWCRPETTRTFNVIHRPGDPKRRPWRFGTEREDAPRGYSDHFPVTVRLKVAGRNS